MAKTITSSPVRKKRITPPAAPKFTVGWREWAVLPGLRLPAVKIKIDTGAQTSSLHAFDIVPFTRKGKPWVRFKVNPLQGDKIVRICTAELVDKRMVKSSNGQKEMRHVVRSAIKIGPMTWDIDITLADRAIMSHRMLLGRSAMKLLAVEPARSFCQGKMRNSDARALYAEEER